VQSETGLVSLTGTPDEVAKAGIPVADIAAGMYAYSGILTALYRRATTGWISAVEVSLFDALAEWLASPAYYTRYGGRQPARVGAQHATIAPYGPFTTADHDTVLLAIQNEREWHTFCQVVLDQPTIAGDHRFATNSARVEHRDELNAVIAARFATLDTGTVLTLLDKANVANARLNSVAQFLDHPPWPAATGGAPSAPPAVTSRHSCRRPPSATPTPR